MDKNVKLSWIEKRRFKRAIASFTVTYSVKTPFEVLLRFGLEDLDTIARDLGGGGIGLLVHDEMPEGTLIDLRFTIFNKVSIGDENSSCKFNLLGEVRYSSLVEKRVYHVGIRFINISPAERNFIEKYIENQK